jgi:DnaJ-class molecular chaperone
VVKKVEDMDYYELLNLRVDASTEDVRKAYLLAVATYHPDALASYGVLSADERRQVLDRIEQAFQTLGDPAARKAYDDVVMPSRPESRQRAFFRKSTEKLEIEDAGGGREILEAAEVPVLPGKIP